MSFVGSNEKCRKHGEKGEEKTERNFFIDMICFCFRLPGCGCQVMPRNLRMGVAGTKLTVS